MLYIAVATAAVFLFNRDGILVDMLLFHPGLILTGQVWRLITWIFIPLNNNPFFVLISLYFYYFIGSSLESEWGTGKFTIYYTLGILLHLFYGFFMLIVFNRAVLIVPIYLNLSMLFAFASLFPDNVIRLFFFIPLKVKWLAIFTAAIYLYSIISDMIAGRFAIAFLPIVAFMNFFVVCGSDLLSLFRPLKARASPQTINFKKAAKKVKRAQKEGSYRHKCAVCGKTDIDYPGLEFRYCSRCDGFHCFCIDHINNHVHFT